MVKTKTKNRYLVSIVILVFNLFGRGLILFVLVLFGLTNFSIVSAPPTPSFGLYLVVSILLALPCCLCHFVIVIVIVIVLSLLLFFLCSCLTYRNKHTRATSATIRKGRTGRNSLLYKKTRQDKIS